MVKHGNEQRRQRDPIGESAARVAASPTPFEDRTTQSWLDELSPPRPRPTSTTIGGDPADTTAIAPARQQDRNVT
jgi:hypothetical protein